nr:MAG TPA: hypothetical protein [Caudoviricetes sp.]
MRRAGYPVLITIGDVRRLARLVEEFSQELEGQLKKVFPIIPIVDEF